MPTAAVIDAQTVRGADTVAADGAGYDAGKKTKGRKRNIATDCLGLLLMVTVTSGGMQDRDSADRLLALLRDTSPPSPWSGPTAATPDASSRGSKPCCA